MRRHYPLAAWLSASVLACTASTGAEAVAAADGVRGSLGKLEDGWCGAIPVAMELRSGVRHTVFRHARARVVTPAQETNYTPMVWNDAAGRFEGLIRVGSWYGSGCADPHIGAHAVTVQLDDDPQFRTIDHAHTIETPFTTFATRRWAGIPAPTHCFDAEFMPVWNVDHWDYRIHDFSVYLPWGGGGARSRVAVAIPFHPATARIANLAVAFDGAAVPHGTAASTNDCWWWDDGTHALYLQKAAMPKGGRYTVSLDFESDTDLFATRVDNIVNSGLGVVRECLNGLVIANRRIHTCVAGGNHELAGDQVATHARDTVAEGDINIDCAERVAVPVDHVMRADDTKGYNLHIKWRQDEWRECLLSADNESLVVRVHSDDTPGTGWAQQLATGIAVTRTQTYYAGKRYIKNVYTLANRGDRPRVLPFVWGREQYIGIDGPDNDKGRFAGDQADRITECRVPIASLPAPWFTAYDAKLKAAMGVIFRKDDPADHGYFLDHTPLRDIKEWPLTVATQRVDSTQNTCTFFDKVYDAVAPGAAVEFTFWMWGGDFSSWDEIEAAIAADARELNGAPAAPRAPAETGATPLRRAMAAGDDETVRTLARKKGADVNTADAEGRTPLLAAVMARRIDWARLLLDCGADVNARDRDGNSPLLKATDLDRLDDAGRAMLDLLLAKGADVNAKDKDGRTALMRAADTSKQQLDVVGYLADKGADVDARDREGRTALMKGTPAVVALLAAKGADVDVRDQDGNTRLLVAAWSKSPLELAAALVNGGADLEARDAQGRTPLMLAAARMANWSWKLAVVNLLAEKGADVDARDPQGRTPLMLAAAAKNRLDLVKALLAHGAKLDARDKDGKTPLMWAASGGQQEVADFLKQQGAKE